VTADPPGKPGGTPGGYVHGDVAVPADAGVSGGTRGDDVPGDVAVPADAIAGSGPAVAWVVRVAVPDAEAELAADALRQAGAAAIEERPGLLIAAPAGGGDPAPLVGAVRGRWPAEVIAVDLDAALDAWRAFARPVVVADRLAIRAPWVPPGGSGNRVTSWLPANHGVTQVRPQRATAGDRPGPPISDDVVHVVEVVIDPGRAFGSGAHPSTWLALAALVDVVRGGERVLDVGCGSGVLAIAALLLGAEAAVGVDVDPAAVAATRANAERNGVGERLVVCDHLAAALTSTPAEDAAAGSVADAAVDSVGGAAVGSVGGAAVGSAGGAAVDSAAGRHGGAAYDIVVANLLLPDLTNVARHIAPRLRQAAAAGAAATVVLSGILAGQRAAALWPFAAAGCEPVDEREQDGWLALTLRAG
jgi:ribosomal protein L11 methylase PrmA